MSILWIQTCSNNSAVVTIKKINLRKKETTAVDYPPQINQIRLTSKKTATTKYVWNVMELFQKYTKMKNHNNKNCENKKKITLSSKPSTLMKEN